MHDIRQAAEFETVTGQKFVHLAEEPGARVELFEKDLCVNNPNAVQDSISAGKNETFGTLKIELEQINRLHSVLGQQGGQRHRRHLDRSRDSEVAVEPRHVALIDRPHAASGIRPINLELNLPV